MRTDRHAERFRYVRALQPRRDAADSRYIVLYNSAGPALQVFAKMADRVDRLAHCDRQRCRFAQQHMAIEILRGQWLLEPGEIELLEMASPAYRLGNAKTLVRIDHQLDRIPDRPPYRCQPLDVLADMRLANLDLYPAKTAGFDLLRINHKLFRGDVQPAAFGVVNRNLALRAARHHMQRQPRLLAAQVPQRSVDRAQRKTGNRTYRGGVCVKEK